MTESQVERSSNEHVRDDNNRLRDQAVIRNRPTDRKLIALREGITWSVNKVRTLAKVICLFRTAGLFAHKFELN